MKLIDWHDVFDELTKALKGFTMPTIKNVIFNPPATIILWNDGTKSVVKFQNGEPYDAEKGFALAYLKKLLGNDNTFNKEINKWVTYEPPKCTIGEGGVPKNESKKSKYYNGFIKCVSNEYNPTAYTTGKVYKVIDGSFNNDFNLQMDVYGEPFKTFEEWVRFSSSKWVEVTGK